MVFQILALSGGGYRGLFSVDILARLERQAGRPIGECFDLIAGTSIGGIIAIGLALGKRAEDIRKVFEHKGEAIFPRGETPEGRIARWRSMARYANRPKYDGTELRKAIEDVVGKDTLLGEAKTRLLVPAVNMTKGSFQIFKTSHHPNFVVDRHRNAADVAMATSAAPFFFPMAKMGDSFYVDGGLAANAPDLCAIHEATHFLDRDIEDIHVLSVGTTTSSFSLPTSMGGNLGALDWLAKERLVSTVFSAQQQLVDFMVGHRLQDRYVRMDATPSPEQCSDLGLDLASKTRRGTLLGMAEGVYQKYAGLPSLQQMLRHTPAAATFYAGHQAD